MARDVSRVTMEKKRKEEKSYKITRQIRTPNLRVDSRDTTQSAKVTSVNE